MCLVSYKPIIINVTILHSVSYCALYNAIVIITDLKL